MLLEENCIQFSWKPCNLDPPVDEVESKQGGRAWHTYGGDFVLKEFQTQLIEIGRQNSSRDHIQLPNR